MYHAAIQATRSDILTKHPNLTFQESGFRYSLSYSPEQVTYSASNSKDKETADVAWAFGTGEIGQTYLLKKDDTYIEGRVTYYTSLHSLDITPGHPSELTQGVEEVLGAKLDNATARRCFACHTTSAVTSRVFEPEKATPGVRCEACHGPGAKHVAAMMAGDYAQSSTTITNPAHLSPSDSVDFCGACHRTWSDVAVEMPTYVGDMSLRFQPYRLEKSRCWKESGDARLTCTACHDPHRPLVRESTTYDSKCLVCHSAESQLSLHTASNKVCKVATRNCTSCHMPKYEVPQTHAKFTDHDIRVVRTNDSGSGSPPP
jgi:hypothetical protein